MIESQDQDDDHPNLIIITQREDGSEGFACSLLLSLKTLASASSASASASASA